MPPPLSLLWRDDDLVAVYKPAGWLVHRTGLDAGETRFVMQTLRDQLGQRVYPVHRLDKGTCGVLVIALHPEAARALGQSFAEHRVTKRYLALVRGWLPEQATVDHPLRPDDAPPDAPVQDALTHFRCLARLELATGNSGPDPRFATTRASLVEAWPQTGRRHQIRRHLKHLAHPILGDATHGKGPLNRWWPSNWDCSGCGCTPGGWSCRTPSRASGCAWAAEYRRRCPLAPPAPPALHPHPGPRRRPHRPTPTPG